MRIQNKTGRVRNFFGGSFPSLLLPSIHRQISAFRSLYIYCTVASVATMSTSDSFFHQLHPTFHVQLSVLSCSSTIIENSFHASLSFFTSQKKHASVEFLAENDSLDVCGVSAIAFAFSRLQLNLDRWLWLYFDKQFLWYIAFCSAISWARSLNITKVLTRFSNDINKMDFRAVLHQNLQRKMQMILFQEVPVS